MNIDDFFAVASPATLASLIADIRQDLSGSAELEERALDCLVAIVGTDDAREMIAAAEAALFGPHDGHADYAHRERRIEACEE